MGRQDKIAGAFAKSKRKFYDLGVSLGGKQVEVLRFFVKEDRYGDETSSTLSSSSISVVVDYPPGEIPMNRFRTDALSGADSIDSSGIFLFDILPIYVFSKFEDNVERGDLLVHFIKDDKGNKLCIVLQISDTLGKFTTEVVWKKQIAAPFNGKLPSEVQEYISDNM
jgi:hypothetical protein